MGSFITLGIICDMYSRIDNLRMVMESKTGLLRCQNGAVLLQLLRVCQILISSHETTFSPGVKLLQVCLILLERDLKFSQNDAYLRFGSSSFIISDLNSEVTNLVLLLYLP